jgi:uncharacterized protein (DUF2252 family)
MNVVAATKAYESWARGRITIVAPDLKYKHRAMAAAAFPFLRATFYRWVELCRAACPELLDAPRLLGVGDLHLENFGTWRDAEGRLAWGINDFDEAYPMPYALDLLRLATSTLLAIREQKLSLGAETACAQLLDGYQAAMAGAGQGFILEESHPLLRAMALGADRDPVHFWAKLTALRPAEPPRPVRRLLRKQLPDQHASFRVMHRTAGLGSLGRQRFVALGECDGGLVAREAKAVLPSAYGWANQAKGNKIYIEAILKEAIRAADPFMHVREGWLLRRLAPHCTRIDIGDYPKRRDEAHLLHAMGREIANVHLGSRDRVPAVRHDLMRRGDTWLLVAAQRMVAATLADWEAWRKAQR